jgi:hypothetical protein
MIVRMSIVALLCATPAYAQATAVAGGNPDRIDVAIPVTASIATRCGFATGAAPSGTYNTPDLNNGFTHDFTFKLQCSGPLRVAVVSAHGGLSASVGTPPPGYTAFAPYQVTLSLAGDAGVPQASAACDAQALVLTASPPCSFRGPASSDQGLRLDGSSGGVSGSYLRVSAPVYAGTGNLVASSAYRDTLTVTLSTSQ